MQIVATDDVGNSKTTTQSITIDTNAPTATYIHYKNGSAVLGAQAFVQSVSQLSFTGTYTDSTPSSELYWDSFVIFQAQDNGSFAFSQNGKQAYCSWRQNPNLVELSGNPFTLTTQRQFTDCVSTLPEGTYYMTHQVYDNATRKDIPTINQFRDVLGLKFTVDTTAPVSQFTQNQANTYHNSSILLQGVSNDVNGVTGVNLYYKNTNSSNWILIETQTNTSNSSTFNWSKTWTPPYQGTFDVKAEATDQAGNTEHSPRMNRIVYDTTRPTFGNINIEEDYLSRYVNGYYGFTISVRADDSLSGIKGSTCEYTLNGTTWTPGMFMNDKCRFGVPSFILYDNQSLDIRVRVNDKAGNTKTSTVVERKVDKALPQSEAMIANEYYGPNSLPFIHGTASDTVSRISDVKLTMRRSSDGKYWTGNSSWTYLPGTQDVLGTSHWVLTNSLPSMSNGVQYTVTPLAWDHVQDFPGIGIADSFIWDNEDPIDPAVSSTSHTSAPNRDRTIDMVFSGANDELSGVAGYFYSFTHAPETPSIGFFNWLPADATHITSRSLSDGTWYFNIRTVDKVGNITSTTHSIPFIIDTTAPTTPSIVSPTSEQYFKSTPILNDWTNATDVSGIASYKVEYVYDDGHTFPGAPYRTTTASQRNHIPNSNEQGGVSFRVQAFDNAGNEGAWSTWVHYYYDTTAPSKPVITNTTAFTNVNAITVNWTGGDDTAYVNSTGAGIAAYSIRYIFTPADGTPDIDWTSNWVSGGNPHTRSGSFGHGEGKYVIYVKTIDMAGNESPESEPYTITYDKTTPVTTASGIDFLWHNTDVTVTLACTDTDGSGCYRTYYSLNGGTEQEGNTVIVSTEGLNTITFYSEDMAGNLEAVQTSDEVKIDKTNPEAQVLSALSFQTGDTTPRSLALSDNTELSQVCYVIDTNTQTCLPLFGTGYSWDITALINTLSVGTHTFTYYVVDTAGNRSDSNTIVEGNDPYASSVVVAAVPQQAVRGAATVATLTPEAVQGAQTTEEETTSPVVTKEEVKGAEDSTQEESTRKPIPWWVYALGGATLLSFIIFLIARRRREEEDKENNIK
ncbi:MAG: Fibronectin type III domain-containing protein [candidate division WS6 bacterium GW2011_GWC2_36_7]|uniref:Fibronectin type III domain-containing protein n=1 Tax=candidate division WS6 bacterium GW2011_GWC2_36_7 TaxID=1619091 RepID=A0A0G0HIF7_9BACT|nr:MAG: Fibronectin type III domain-containing protein [candidate division WS6 bacterium GW2011_GWC2_36_7]